MRSSAPADEIETIARTLAPGHVEAISELKHGNNSRVFRVDTAAGRFALKRYPSNDTRPRLAAEVAALRYFERHAIERTPRVVAVAPEHRCALFTWMQGEKVSAVSDADVVQFAQFQIALDRAIDQRAREEIGEASEACLSGQRIVAQIERRFARLGAVKHDVPEFAALFDDVLMPSLQRFAADLPALAADIAPEARTVIPSDLGAHNALRGPDGRLSFLDFEYFGWDDPVTSIANFVMHPGMSLTAGQQAAYRDRLLAHFCRHGEAERLALLMPLYALRWCAIILGELLPERWQHRQESKAQLGTWDEARRTQIAKARALMDHVLPDHARPARS
ncbi:MAG: aminoglycoside phosphotransferase family protein [Reyranellaceae bacterium]